jgi:hypothetical protein
MYHAKHSLSDEDADIIFKRIQARTMCEKCFSVNVISGEEGTWCKDCGYMKKWEKK